MILRHSSLYPPSYFSGTFSNYPLQTSPTIYSTVNFHIISPVMPQFTLKRYPQHFKLKRYPHFNHDRHPAFYPLPTSQFLSSTEIPHFILLKHSPLYPPNIYPSLFSTGTTDTTDTTDTLFWTDIPHHPPQSLTTLSSTDAQFYPQRKLPLYP